VDNKGGEKDHSSPTQLRWYSGIDYSDSLVRDPPGTFVQIFIIIPFALQGKDAVGYRFESCVTAIVRRGWFVDHVRRTVSSPRAEQLGVCLDEMAPDYTPAVAKFVLILIDPQEGVVAEPLPDGGVDSKP
jgi:hypothetical protein